MHYLYMLEVIFCADRAYAFSDDSIFLCKDIPCGHIDAIVVVIWLEITSHFINTEVKWLSLLVEK